MDGRRSQVKGKDAEQFVHVLAYKTFLTDWCFTNPEYLDNGTRKELCDLLVVFGDVAIIWQVKNTKLDKESFYKEQDIEKNLNQLVGAYNTLFKHEQPIELENPRRGKETFDPKVIKDIYLVSALVGPEPELSPVYFKHKNHTIHNLNRSFTEVLLTELDTIKDFCEYLEKVQEFVENGKEVIDVENGKGLLSYYLKNERDFGELKESNVAAFIDETWDSFVNRPEVKAKKKAEEISYKWDELIGFLHKTDALNYEIIARELARTSRFQRRRLAKSFIDAAIQANKSEYEDKDYRRLMIDLDDGITYCFLFSSEISEHRKMHLELMLRVARGIKKEIKMVIGIATKKISVPGDENFNFAIYTLEEWTEEAQRDMDVIQEQTGIFKDTKLEIHTVHEYPID